MNRALLILAIVTVVCTVSAAELSFERVGVPCVIRSLTFDFVTQGTDGSATAWCAYEDSEMRGLIGVDVSTGESLFVSASDYGASHVSAVLGVDGNIYMYVGKPAAHFLRYEIATGTLADLGAPADPAHYFADGRMASDGRFYVGSYPQTALVCVDTNTGEVANLGPLTDDSRNMYVFPSVEIDADDIVYCPVGLHHQELWAYNSRTGDKCQILPPELQELPGSPKLWTVGGKVYGRSGSTRYLCSADSIVTDTEMPEAVEPTPLRTGENEIDGIDAEGVLMLKDSQTGKKTQVPTDYPGRQLKIYCVGDERDGKIYGGTFGPAHTFSYDVTTGAFNDHGQISSGRIQVYDIMNTPNGLLLGSYVGAWLNLWKPEEAKGAGNPVVFARGDEQERPLQWTMGPDGRAYIGSRPIKGHLGGALARVDLSDNSVEWWRNIIPNQSIISCAPVPETGELLCTSSTYGGSSSKPIEKEGFVFLWDCQEERVAYKCTPIPGTNSYGATVRARNGIVYVLAYSQYIAFDPVARKTLFVGNLPGTAHFPGIHDRPVGAEELLITLVDDTVCAIDPKDHSLKVIGQHETIGDAHGFFVTEEGILYYGVGAELWRCDLGL